MKTRNILLVIALLCLGMIANAQLDTGEGTGWEGLFPTEPLVIDNDFSGYPFFHTDKNPDQGNSSHSLDPITQEVIYGYMDTTIEVNYIGSDVKVTYDFKQVAFAPDWSTAYAFKNSTESTANVSNGFVEISRSDSVYSNIPTIRGYMIVDLRNLEFVDIIQWTHSSTGGNKRGVMCEFSVDGGTTWDTLRYQPGNAWSNSFTKDVSTGTKTSNGYRCDPSAYGMTWEDGIWASNIMLRFGECGGQTPRIHDLKVYGTISGETAVDDIVKNNLKVFAHNNIVRVSEPANVGIYSITGKLVLSKINSNYISMTGLPQGIYIVKAVAGKKMSTVKIYNR